MTLTIDSFNLAQYEHIVIAKEEINFLAPVNNTAYKTIEMQVGVITKDVTYSVHVKKYNDTYENSVGTTYTDIRDAIAKYNSIKLQ